MLIFVQVCKTID